MAARESLSFLTYMRTRIIECYGETAFFPAGNNRMVCFVGGWEVYLARNNAGTERMSIERVSAAQIPGRRYIDLLAFNRLHDWESEWFYNECSTSEEECDDDDTNESVVK